MADQRAWTRHWMLYLLMPALAAVLLICGYIYASRPATTLIIVRHAEKSAAPPDNPPLSAEGEARALTLMQVVEGADVKAVYASQFPRTQQTVQPLAERLRLPVTNVNADDVEGLVEQVLTNHAGAVVLIASHSNKIPLIIEALGGGPIPPIAETEYDQLYIVTVPPLGKTRVIQLKYGKTS
ncbi:MAG TPA: phosphoglycerate mutase family protein [Pyrinomonadaceae bacterium]|nr:phosphoglycerate mutase family protein [Pyrinomonadaceae bacterium]